MLLLHEFFVARVESPPLPVTALRVLVLWKRRGMEDGGRGEAEIQGAIQGRGRRYDNNGKPPRYHYHELVMSLLVDRL